MKLKIALAGIVIGLANSSGALADWKGYPGLNCMPSSGANDVRRTNTGATNWQDSSTTIYCPVVRDIATGGDNRIHRINVRLYDNHSTVNGWCRVVSRTIDGATHDWQHKNWTGTGDFTLSFESINTSNWGNIALYCSIPGTDDNGVRKSFIRSYSVEEM